MINQWKAVLFDLDGTLLDSEWFYYKAWKKALETHGFALESYVWLNEFAGTTDRQAFELLRNKYGLKADPETFFSEVRANVAQQHEKEVVPLMPGAADLLSFLHHRGVTMAVVTSSKRPVATYHLEKNGIKHYFRVLVTRTEVDRPKPDPEPYDLCVAQLKLEKSDCLALEDSVTGTTAAKAAQLTCFGVQTHESIRQKLNADLTFDNLHEVREYLED